MFEGDNRASCDNDLFKRLVSSMADIDALGNFQLANIHTLFIRESCFMVCSQ